MSAMADTAISANHAGQMDAIYRGQRHIYDLTRKYYLLGRDQLIRDLAPPPGAQVLEIGCGTGRNLIVAARRWPQATFYGLDISSEMLKSAQQAIARAGLSHRIHLAQGDAADFDGRALFGVNGFDRVFQSYTLSMIPDWQGAVREAARHLAPAGELHIVDFGQQEKLPRWFHHMLHAWLARFHVSPRAELDACLQSVASSAGMTAHLESLYRGYAWAARLKSLA